MAETNYTQKFKLALANEIIQYLQTKSITKKLKVITEYEVILENGLKNKIDIAIINERDRGLSSAQPNRIVGIEIEVRSSQSYIELNYEKFKSFIECKKKRVGGLIQLFTEKTNISSVKYDEIFKKSNEDMFQILGFSYAMRDFEVCDERTYKKRAEEVLKNIQFKRILNRFIREVHKLKYK